MSNQLKAKKRRKHDLNHLSAALKAVQSNAMSVRRAADVFSIPKSTLHDKLKEKTPLVSVPRTVLTPEEEKAITDWALHMARIGYGRTRHEIMQTVKHILDDDKRPNPFKDNRPGKDWWFGFVKRNPSIGERNPQLLGKERAIISPEKVRKWFEDYEKYICQEISEPQLLLDPSRLYNADESGFSLCPKSGKVVAQRGSRTVYNFGRSDKTQITVLACMSATGHYIKPMVVYPGQRFSYNPLEKFQDAFMGRSENGWMDSDLFYTWIKDIFIPSVDERGIPKPVVLFVDGHSTHMSMRLSDLCRANKIELYCLLEHASHVLQPCDLRLFHALKEAWRHAVRDYQMNHIGEYVTKQSFAEVFKGAWEKTTTIANAVNGFREAGLFPLDPSKVLNSLKLEPATLFRQEKDTSLPTASSASTPKEAGDAHTQPDDQIHIQQQPLTKPVQNLSKDRVDMGGEHVSHVVMEHLKVPLVQVSKPKQTKVTMPKAITGNKFREMIIEKDKKKAEELQAKEDRKRERQKKKEERENEKMRKKKEREEKKRIREEQKRQKEAARKKKTRIERQFLSSSSDTDSDEVVYSDGSDTESFLNINIKKCAACDEDFDGSPFWIRCTRCGRNMHRLCVKSIDLSYLSEEEIEDIAFECDYC